MKQSIVLGFFLTLYVICGGKAQMDVGLTEEEIAQLREFKEVCIKESEVEREVVEEAERGVVVMDENLACFAACMMKKVGVMREDGSIDVEAGIAKIPPKINKERAEEVFRKCIEFQSNNICVKAGMIGKCLMDHKNYVLEGKM